MFHSTKIVSGYTLFSPAGRRTHDNHRQLHWLQALHGGLLLRGDNIQWQAVHHRPGRMHRLSDMCQPLHGRCNRGKAMITHPEAYIVGVCYHCQEFCTADDWWVYTNNATIGLCDSCMKWESVSHKLGMMLEDPRVYPEDKICE